MQRRVIRPRTFIDQFKKKTFFFFFREAKNKKNRVEDLKAIEEQGIKRSLPHWLRRPEKRLQSHSKGEAPPLDLDLDFEGAEGSVEREATACPFIYYSPSLFWRALQIHVHVAPPGGGVRFGLYFSRERMLDLLSQNPSLDHASHGSQALGSSLPSACTNLVVGVARSND